MTMQLDRAASPRATGTAPAERPASRRDASVDLVRAVCLLVVVALHAMMVGVSLEGGVPVIENAMEGWTGFPILTWIVQVMPLFFVLGGFSAHRQWQSMRERGATPTDYLARRLRRLLPPVVGAVAATALALAAISAAGLPAALVVEAGFRLSQPLWFMGVYLLCTLLVPTMLRMHEAAAARTTLGLAGAALVVDALRAATGVDAIGFANLLLVWLAVQQLGFWMADGSVDRWTRAAVRSIAIAAVAAAAVLCLVGLSSPDLFQALNPPSLVLVLVGVAQAAVVVLARESLQRIARGPVVSAMVGAINARAMTIYAWHMLVLIGLAGASLAAPALLPEPLSGAWWGSRPLWLLVVAVVTAAVVRAAGVLEAAPAGGVARARQRATHGGWVVTAYLVAAVAVLGVLVGGREPVAWGLAAGALALVLAVARGARGVGTAGPAVLLDRDGERGLRHASDVP